MFKNLILILLAAASLYFIFSLFRSENSLFIENKDNIRGLSPEKNIIANENKTIKLRDPDTIIEQNCGEEMKNLLARLQRDLKENNENVYHLIGHAQTSIINKEKYIMSRGDMLSILDFRKYSGIKNKENDYNKASPSPEDIITLSNLLKQNDIAGLKNHFLAYPELINSTITGKSFLSFALINSTNSTDYLSMVRELSTIGMTPSISDLATSVEIGKTTDFIAELAKYSKEDLASIWHEKNINFNLTTFSASHHRFGHALFFFNNFGIPASVEQDFNILDFVNLSSNDITEQENELILLAIKMRITPYDIRRKNLLIKHLNRQGSIPPENYDYLSVANELFHLDEDLETEKLSRLEKSLGKGASIFSQIALINSSNPQCEDNYALTSEHHGNNIEQSSPTENSSDSFSAVKTLYNSIVSLTRSQITDSLNIKDAYELIKDGESEKGIQMFAEYIQDRSTKDKEELYSKLLSLCIVTEKNGKVIRNLTERGARMRENDIFLLISNNNYDAIELYKKNYDLTKARSAGGLTVVQFAEILKADHDLLSRLQP